MPSGNEAGRRNAADKYQVFEFQHIGEVWTYAASSAMNRKGGNK